MKKSIILAGICIMLLITGSAFAQGTPSAKFAATYSENPALSSAVFITDSSTDKIVVDSNTGFTLARIKVPQQKELLIGVSAEIGLVTDTSVKGKNGGAARAIADSEAYVTVYAVPVDGGSSEVAKPGKIILSKRVQELDATLAGVIQTCPVSCETTCALVDDDNNPDTPDIIECSTTCADIDIAAECEVTDEEIGLFQSTTAAHHFNFLLPDMNQGVYDIKAVFTTGATAEVDICDMGEECSFDPEGTATASAAASAIINKYMLTVQEVRASKFGINDVDIEVEQ